MQYATQSSPTANSSVSCPVSLYALADTQEAISQEENELFQILSKNESDSIWGEAIRQVIKGVRSNGDVQVFRKLITELKSQYRDSPQVMQHILGAEATRLLDKL